MKLLIILPFLALASSSCPGLRVETPLGGVIGSYKISHYGRKYKAFEGIPYAQPPLGKLRFQPPKPVQKWTQDLPATKKGSECTQYHMLQKNGDKVSGCEDCLYLNIYVPPRNNEEMLLPVMLWIHDGAFQYGSGNNVNERFLMDRDVVLVAINYRLGPFGFLSTGDRVVPGNMGLKDQTVALRFVSNNIKYFGGDPESVTIFGLNAGAASVQYHYLSPLSAGLFQRGLSISGVALDPWPQTERAPEKAKKLGALMGCPTKNSTKMVSCLRERPPRLIAQAVHDFMAWLYNPITPFGPVIEKQKCPRPFIRDSPIEIINRGEALDVPWISGVVAEEGLYTAAEFVDNRKLLKELNDDWDKIAPSLLDFNDTVSLSQQKNVSEMARKHYLGSKSINSVTDKHVVQMIGDRLFKVDFEKAVRLQAKINRSPVWTYYYTYRAKYSQSDALSGSTKDFGVCQGDDVALILGTKMSSTTRALDVHMQQFLLDFYTSYAIHGEPKISSVTWKKLDPDEKKFYYLHIKNPKDAKMASANNFAEKKFWESINFNENKLPKS
ncbi:carboxylic ester hydrolase-like [Hylaeus volcanicus]|uniref:carboxylic ester hydrolase-like n=1 Tax=Hylaeus volcanicus TaxID=313075 RepID=UPI0023B77561|nr:carboxylic ester hydrolase-like [Hylaeus volcanicus]